MILPVIMAGGSGSRLWPLSRQLYPKQFLPLSGEQTMLQETCARLSGLQHLPPLIVCGEEHRFTVAEQLRAIHQDHGGIVLEPAGRNTAPAIALAALQALASGEGDPLLLVLAADHVIRDLDAFTKAIQKACESAQQGELVTFGIVPTAPETGYGYIRRKNSNGNNRLDASRVEQFVEKPDWETAQKYVQSGDYFWNSGMFLFRASRYIEELGRHRPAILSSCERAMASAAVDVDFVRPERSIFLQCPDDSIDYAVMENTADAVVVPLDCGWSDLGSWSALWEVSDKDDNGNTANGDVMLYDSRNCYVQSDHKLIAAIGLEDLVVVESDDAIMVAAKDRVQDVKKVVERLKAENRPEAMVHRKVYRPWGFYDSVDAGERFQVKRIVVNPGAQLSLQMHHHRAEHWVVVSGTARVTCGDEQRLLSENQSTYIPLGVKHRLENPGAIPLELIEVQSGSYLGEDDIVRFEDKYSRS
ncbi:mannose-1-phosphate guanylyltransferase/mannose-6-phosphate isomerase [Microbulbifer flavimaris]|uniref:mannose-1-phosphate guanylyltransferase n=1 Tax=Microbulbifer flavimaris TaxID=1781068 RepID=A0ABX4I086_9GAMM|nr:MULTISPECIES: mannose-1-phosphate guanylyltransferase/mannose-6-phosphate isomerase [Microbulbifer]KUJ83638.1 mannose-1-phosphate guanyltransferase [Microbulbifer sp. ZGT114]PCO05799.1 mannose-1-phosphate guanylyltransferase/mannose-6-phosphate isomerase [Microbulbifer flavimaris]